MLEKLSEKRNVVWDIYVNYYDGTKDYLSDTTVKFYYEGWMFCIINNVQRLWVYFLIKKKVDWSILDAWGNSLY